MSFKVFKVFNIQINTFDFLYNNCCEIFIKVLIKVEICKSISDVEHLTKVFDQEMSHSEQLSGWTYNY